MTKQPSRERRSIKRFSVHLKVYDQESDELIGYVQDLSIRGMKLQSLEPIRDKREIAFWFGATPDEPPGKRVYLPGFSIWSSFSDTTPRYYYSGIHFVDPTEEQLDRIQQIIDETRNLPATREA